MPITESAAKLKLAYRFNGSGLGPVALEATGRKKKSACVSGGREVLKVVKKKNPKPRFFVISLTPATPKC